MDAEKTLILAIHSGNPELVQRLLNDSRVDPSASRNYPIQLAVQLGLDEIVDVLLADRRVNPADRNKLALRDAIQTGNFRIAQKLLNDRRIDPSDRGNELIRWAVANENWDAVDLLLTDPRVLSGLIRFPIAEIEDDVDEILLKLERLIPHFRIDYYLNPSSPGFKTIRRYLSEL